MTDQLGLPLAPGRAHTADPAAAKQAAKASRAQAASHRARILEHVKAERDYGATYREVALALQVEPAEANRRLCELRESGHVLRLAATRAPRPGSPAHIYVTPAFAFGREEAT